MKPEDTRSVRELQAVVSGGAKAKFVFFWGYQPRRPNAIDESCLSNWYPADFEVDGIIYPTAEHFMMAEKAKLFGDDNARAKILNANSPGAAKALGRQIISFDENTWRQHRFEIVVAGCVAKFGQNPALRGLLCRTGTKVLVEASPRDLIWGVGLARDDERVENPMSWRGLNLLGFALMEVRSNLA